MSISKISSIDDFASELSLVDDFDLALVTAVIGVAQIELNHLEKLNNELTKVVKKEAKNRAYKTGRGAQQRKRAAEIRARKQCSSPQSEDPSLLHDSPSGDKSSKYPAWEEISDGIPDRLFRRKYRMSKEEFHLLCSKIKDKVGEKEFRPTNTQALCGYTKVAGPEAPLRWKLLGSSW